MLLFKRATASGPLLADDGQQLPEDIPEFDRQIDLRLGMRPSVLQSVLQDALSLRQQEDADEELYESDRSLPAQRQ